MLGVYHHTSRKHLGRYVDEFAFRLNEGNCIIPQTKSPRCWLGLFVCSDARGLVNAKQDQSALVLAQHICAPPLQ